MASASSEVAPRLVVDNREPEDLVQQIESLGVDAEWQQLAPADFIIGDLAIERKSVADFHASLIDKRLFEQMARMKETYARCALLLEGDPAFFEERMHPRAVYGALASIAIDFAIPILPVADKDASAKMLATLAKRAARERGGGGYAEVRFRPRSPSPGAQQRFAVQGLPNIGDVVSDALLEHFGSVRRVYAASERELLRVPGVGKGRAHDITTFLDAAYHGRQRRLSE